MGDLTIYIGSVPTEHLDTFDTKLKASFERLVKEGLDMDRMKMVISREERQVSYQMCQANVLYLTEFHSSGAALNHRKPMYSLES